MHAKLCAPLGPINQVIRSKFVSLVDVNSLPKLILVHGPAGFGKTTVMLQLREELQRQGFQTSWVTLDDADNEIKRFILFLSQAIIAVKSGDSVSGRSARAASDIAFEMLDVIAQTTVPFAIFLDDVEVLNNSSVLDLISRIIVSLPPHGCLVFGARNVPAVPLGKLRATGGVLEIDAKSLRFTTEETKQFVAKRSGAHLTEDQFERLCQKTEGWITAISLVTMSLQSVADANQLIESSSGSNVTLSDFLSEEVVARLPSEKRTFLLKTSVLKELNGSLCDDVCEIEHSGEMLMQLERDNLFLLPLDIERQAYRYHNLFLGFLRKQLERDMPGVAGVLHGRAAHWYEKHNRPIPAIDHAMLSNDKLYAVKLLTENLQTFLGHGRLRLLSRWIEVLPPDLLEKNPAFKIAWAWALTFTRGAKAALRMVQGMDVEELADEPSAMLRALRPMLLAMTDEIDEAYEQGLDALAFVPIGFGFSYGMLAQTLTNTSLIKGRFGDAHKYADQARKAQENETGKFNLTLSDAAEATIDLMQGRLKQASVRLNQVDSPLSTKDSQHRPRPGNAYYGILLAETLYESGRCDEAKRLLEIYVPLVREFGQPDTLIISHVTLAKIVAAMGDGDRALQLLTELEAVGHRLGLMRVVVSARLERVRLSLVKGDIRSAKELLGQAESGDLWDRVSRQWFVANDILTYSLYQIRCLIHGGQPAQALVLLKQELELAELGQRHRRALKIRIMMADAMQRDGQYKSAMRMLTRALEFAAREGFFQTFLEEGPVVMDLLKECLENLDAVSGENAFSVPSEWLEGFNQVKSHAGENQSVAGLAESLTRKELRVLALLAQGLSNKAMSEKLYVSESTVRTHLRNIFAKLQAENRVKAVALARRYRLVE